jgi:hypothetical protein
MLGLVWLAELIAAGRVVPNDGDRRRRVEGTRAITRGG